MLTWHRGLDAQSLGTGLGIYVFAPRLVHVTKSDIGQAIRESVTAHPYLPAQGVERGASRRAAFEVVLSAVVGSGTGLAAHPGERWEGPSGPTVAIMVGAAG